jgi:chloride channel 3/4/5
MPLRHTNSLASIASITTANETNPSGPLSGPSNTTWRRQRLLRIGSSQTTPQIPFDSDESHYLRTNQAVGSYGTLPTRRDPPSTGPPRKFLTLRNFSFSGQAFPRVSTSHPVSPVNASPTSFRGNAGSYLVINKQRPISAYDAPFIDHADSEDDLHARTNGIRVWYSSFSSIDWLHDAIKDSVRFSRLRRGKSLRSKIRLLLDKSMGWIIVTLVGFFTALVAFLVVRGEQWFFDSKEGYCRTDWTKPKRFCCPISDIDDLRFTRSFSMRVMHETCPAWRTWAEVFGASTQDGHVIGYQAEIIQYVAYAFIAVR